MSRQSLMDIYERLLEYYGPQHWWPGDGPFEISVGAILTQNTNWNNVEKAIHNLKQAQSLSPEAMFKLSNEQLAALIRPAGYFNLKAQRLRNFLQWLFDQYAGVIENLETLAPSTLRRQLLEIKGIGPETADSICLYAFNKPIFVVDAYTGRIFGRHGFLHEGCGYDEIQELFQSDLEKDEQLYNEFHALIVRLGKEHCKKRAACDGCPLEDLPHELEIGLY